MHDLPYEMLQLPEELYIPKMFERSRMECKDYDYTAMIDFFLYWLDYKMIV